VRPPYCGLKHDGTATSWRGYRVNPVICGRKFCADCGRWRHVVDFGMRRGKPYSYCRTCDRRQQREYLHRRSALQRERRREYDRIYFEAQRRAAGIRPRNFHNRSTVIDKREAIRLDIEPLRAAIEAYHAGHDTNELKRSYRALARATGIDERKFAKYVTSNQWIELANADKIAVALGIPLAVLYPYDEETAA
jgi:hypothetical protein